MENTQVDSQSVSPQKLSPGFFFLSLGVLITLITSVVSFLNLVFGTLNKKFPDVLNATYQYGYNTYDFEGIRASLATLIIFFPVYLLISYFWSKHSKSNPVSTSGGLGKIDMTIRKWMIYLILFIASLVIVIDLVYLVQYFVSGEITIRFILKVFAALLTALVAGSYYVYELGLIKQQKFVPKIYAVVSAIIILLSIVWSFAVIGSPSQQRLWRFDDRRIQDLGSIQWQVINYWQQKEKLPLKLADLSNPLSGFSVPVDPEFEKGKMYEYIVKDADTFEICATFSLPIPKGWREYDGGGYPRPLGLGGKDVSVSYPYPGGGINESWDHEAGRACFERTIDKDMYPPFPKG
jgi:hypothetical protein